jgi:predicted transcriptional regulator with HTH domain
MEQTIINLGLLIESAKNGLKNNDFKQVKTIMNTYRTLLERFTYLNYSDKRIDEYRITLSDYQKQLEKLHANTDELIQKYILNNDYKNTNDLAEISRRAEKCSTDIKGILDSRKQWVLRNNQITNYNIKKEIN